MLLCRVRLLAARKGKVAAADVSAFWMMRARPAAKMFSGAAVAQGLYAQAPRERTEQPTAAPPPSPGLRVRGTYVSVREERCPLHRRAVLQIRQRVHIQFECALQVHAATGGHALCEEGQGVSRCTLLISIQFKQVTD